jgi:hypothetical protein
MWFIARRSDRNGRFGTHREYVTSEVVMDLEFPSTNLVLRVSPKICQRILGLQIAFVGSFLIPPLCCL